MEKIWVLFGLMTVLAAIAAFSLAALARMRRIKSGLEIEQGRMLDAIEALDDRVWEMAASEALHRSLVESLGDLVVRRNSAGRILYANAAYAALLGISVEATRGHCLEPLVLAVTPGQQQPDGTRLFDELIQTDSGEKRWIAWIETPVSLEGDSTVRQRVGRDVSGRVAAERLQEEARAKAESASEAKSRFLATVSHEFRTPLNGILGMSDLLNDTRLEPEQVAYVRALQSSGKALLSLVDEILDLTKVEAGKIELARQAFDPAHLIEDVVELMAPRAQTRGLDIAAFVAADLPSQFMGDEERIRQILVNLLGNAIKFTASGGVALHARAIAAAGTITGLEIKVEDTGSGIPADRLDAIFLEFEQASTETSRRHGGTGLGLAIVRRLAEAMGGRATVESCENKGSVFTVTLPLAATAENRPMESGAETLSGQHILIISDSPFTAPAMAAIARAAQASVTLSHADGAKPLLAGQPWDAVIIDYAIGAVPAGELRLAAAEAGHRKVLVALSPQERRLLGRPVDAGFTGHLVRPVRVRSLMDRLLPQAPTIAVAPLERPHPQASGLRILVAEDNEINALIVLKTLERHGSHAVWARDGNEALALAEASMNGAAAPFDLVLMDVRMPHMDGLEATAKIRMAERQAGNMRRLPVIGISANVAAEDVAEAKASGMDDCLPKPLDRERLFQWLAKVLAAKPAQDAA